MRDFSSLPALPNLSTKTLLIIFCVILLIIGLGIFFAWFNSSPQTIVPPEIEPPITTTNPPNQPPVGGNGQFPGQNGQFPTGITPPNTVKPPEQTESKPPLSQTRSVTQLGNLPSLYTTNSPEKGTIGYNPLSGSFFRIKPDGTIEQYSKRLFYNVSNVTWSPNRDKAILEFPDGLHILYDFNNDKQVNLPQHWKDFSFSPQNDKIVFKSIGLDTDENWLAYANTDGSGISNVEPLGDNESRVQVTWSPNGQVLGVYQEALSGTKERLHFISPEGEVLPPIEVRGLNVQVSWSPDGKYLLYNSADPTDEFRPHIWIVDPLNPDSTHVKLPVTTWGSKCAFHPTRNVLYCAEPPIIPESSGLFPNLNSQPPTPDRLVEIDLQSGKKYTVPLPEHQWIIDSITVGDDGRSLIVHDKQMMTLEKISLY